MSYFYIGLFFLSVLAGFVMIWRKIRKKDIKLGWIVPYTIFYSVFSLFAVFAASIAYDDPADPNYARYQGWTLRDFVFRDLRALLIWLLIGALLYLIFERGLGGQPVKKGAAIVLGILAALLAAIAVLSFLTFQQTAMI